MGVRPLSAVRTGFDVLLGVVPGSTGVGHEQRHQHTHERCAGQQAAQRLDPQESADQHRRDHGRDAGQDHLAQRSACGDVHAPRAVGLGGAFHETGDFTELAAHLFHHVARGSADGGHGHRPDQEGQGAAEEQADHHHRVHDVERQHLPRRCHRGGEGREQRQRGQRGGTDGETLANRGGGVAQRVEAVGDLANLWSQAGHLADAAGVIGHGAVGVDGHRHAHGGQHAHRRDGDAV